MQNEVQSRGISRICHFTQSRNLVHIASDPEGLKSTNALQADQNACFTATDTKRIDGYTDHICCSVEYPNAWYLAHAEAEENLFKDWVVLFVSPVYLWNPDTRFCARNAAASGGAYVVKALGGFQSLFAQEVDGAGGKTWRRSGSHLVCSPTDDQAEVLIKALILKADILGVAVKDEKQAKNEIARLRHAGIAPDAFRFVISPVLFDKYKLASAIRAGRRPEEKLYL